MLSFNYVTYRFINSKEKIRPLAKNSEVKKPDPKKPGRPRSEEAHRAILSAARTLMEEVGPTRITVEAVAKRAGVGKPTIYRHWANAQELAMAALVDNAKEPDNADKQSGVDDLKNLVDTVVERLNSKRGRQMALMLAGAEPDSELFKAFANRVVLEGRQKGLEILQAEQKAGRIRMDADLEMTLDLIFGAVLLRLLLRHAPLDDGMGQDALDVILAGIGS